MIRKLLPVLVAVALSIVPERPPISPPIFSAHYTNFDDATLVSDVARIAGVRALTTPEQRTRLVFKNAAGDVATVFVADSTKFQNIVSRMQKGGYDLIDYSQGLSVTGK